MFKYLFPLPKNDRLPDGDAPFRPGVYPRGVCLIDYWEALRPRIIFRHLVNRTAVPMMPRCIYRDRNFRFLPAWQ